MTDSTPIDHARAWSFDEFVREGLSLIPAHAPQWTNHNPSDPGITLVELLAYLSEILCYRALRVTPDAKLHFLRLLEGVADNAIGSTAHPSDFLFGAPSKDVDAAILERVDSLSHVQCAVTPGDYEQFAVEQAAAHIGTHHGILARCLPMVDLRRIHEGYGSLAIHAPADVSVVLSVGPEMPIDEVEGICRHVQTALAPRCLLTTRAYVIRATHLLVSVACRISPRPGISLTAAIDAVDVALQHHFRPARTGETYIGTAQFGRPLQLATIAAIIDRTDEVDYVENISARRIAIDGATNEEGTLIGVRIGIVARIGEDTRLGGLASIGMRRLQTDRAGEAETVAVQPWELVHVQLARDAVQGPGDVGPRTGSGSRFYG